ncbi:MAG: bifunctional oligoribonuclease/PAP phosphatase NrnA [Clostridia bacterium]|nr:bifunctional oligoribonuclease/PAP phosphatase NrnA [Clostridia bacterium]
MISLEQTAKSLLEHDNILLIAHVFPDGDTLGSCLGLCHALQDLGKHVRMTCFHTIPSTFDYLFEGLDQEDFEEQYIVTVDVADLGLIGVGEEKYGHMIDLCIDHHATNRIAIENKYVRPSAAACAEIIFDLIGLLNTPITPVIAACLYTGISTDTGCFRFSNVTGYTHYVASQLMKLDYDFETINRILFEERSRARIELEAALFGSMRYYYQDRCAVAVISQELLQKTGATEADLDGITGLPRTIRGVLVGVTLRECEDGKYKVSVRTHEPYDAAAICAQFGGGGHVRAAGCTVSGKTAQELEQEMLHVIKGVLGEI